MRCLCGFGGLFLCLRLLLDLVRMNLLDLDVDLLALFHESWLEVVMQMGSW